jgi:hypothetical protein
MNQGTFEFFASKHVHQWIVNGVDGEPVDEILVGNNNKRAFTLETKTPVNSDAKQSNGKRTEPEREHIDRHA